MSIKIKSESILNGVLKERKHKDFSILYVSPWDKWSNKILDITSEEIETPLYVVDSFSLPQAFSTFSITSAPTLVHFRGGKITVDVEYPKVYDYVTNLQETNVF